MCLCCVKASGVSVHPECVQIFNDIKLKHNFRYIIYALTDDLTQIRVLKTAPVCECFPSCNTFLSHLQDSEHNLII